MKSLGRPSSLTSSLTMAMPGTHPLLRALRSNMLGFVTDFSWLWNKTKHSLLQWLRLSVMASHIASNSTVCSTTCACSKEKQYAPHHWPFVRGILWPQGPVMRKGFLCPHGVYEICWYGPQLCRYVTDDVIISSFSIEFSFILTCKLCYMAIIQLWRRMSRVAGYTIHKKQKSFPIYLDQQHLLSLHEQQNISKVLTLPVFLCHLCQRFWRKTWMQQQEWFCGLVIVCQTLRQTWRHPEMGRQAQPSNQKQTRKCLLQSMAPSLKVTHIMVLFQSPLSANNSPGRWPPSKIGEALNSGWSERDSLNSGWSLKFEGTLKSGGYHTVSLKFEWWTLWMLGR